MATKTKNYNLIKPALTDDADIRVINGNMDVLDTQLKTVADSAISGNKNAYTNISVSSDYIWTFTKGSGANVSYDTIKKATASDGVRGGGSYKPNADSTKYHQLQYHFGTIPNKGSSTGTVDCGTLKFNHWGATPYNTALSVPNTSDNRPFISYQNGKTGTDYTAYKELAWKSDADAKLDKTGGTLTGNIYTNSSIFKSSNNSVLQIGGSTDGTHGARINLSGEKQKDAGLVKITADNGTNSNVFEVSTGGAGSRYNFNGLTTYMNSSEDYFRLGGDDAYVRLAKGNKLVYTNAKGINVNGIDCIFNSSNDYFKFGTDSNYFAFNTDGSVYCNYKNSGNKRVQIARYVGTGETWYLETDTILIQGGTWIPTATTKYINVTLPRPYSDTQYTLLTSCNTTRNPVGLSGRCPSGRKISNTTIQLNYYDDREQAWITMGVK